jgi:hypothetical protein
MKCSPAGIFLAVMLVAAWMAAGRITHAAVARKTGLMQIAAGTGAFFACLAAVVLVWVAMRIVDATPVPVTPVTDVPAGRKPVTVTAMTLTPEDRDEMTADADMLASGELDFVVTERKGLFELREDDEALS